MSRVRGLVREVVDAGRLMHLGVGSSPLQVFPVWYQAGWKPDVLRWISRVDRAHSRTVRLRGNVAGSIVAAEPDGLGDAVRGVRFAGFARELPTSGIDQQLDAFVARWPKAAGPLDRQALADGTSAMRLYEVSVERWILFDEEAFPADPRQEILAEIEPHYR
ncbi:hypothetical protein EDD29_0023 [Actinocorallia herbida]|uniref:Pyridoxamine 5'-phosphate oxidase n=1 Tax=Actinocorallia herbida TaxID=58109 RepID=A0A3N1CMM9_9ACTN|nr:pyridoxamine 5'-phosphate oxidase family protein [Actinocorallia herbida]ROO82543.1 hypothetical protein EDD29_0023 [Actinocorallia herbida]